MTVFRMGVVEEEAIRDRIFYMMRYLYLYCFLIGPYNIMMTLLRTFNRLAFIAFFTFAVNMSMLPLCYWLIFVKDLGSEGAILS
jgi:Na+-driven multidrug efflux pump